jgi:hypothetical protein
VPRFVAFDGVLTLTYNATSLILPTAASITTEAGDAALFVSEGSGNWRCLGYWRASGASIGGAASLQGTGLDVDAAGFRGVPQNSQSANYTIVAADAGKHLIHPGAGDTFTIPANSSVAFEIGTAITFVNMDSNAVSIAITTDTMNLPGTGTTGTRQLVVGNSESCLTAGDDLGGRHGRSNANPSPRPAPLAAEQSRRAVLRSTCCGPCCVSMGRSVTPIRARRVSPRGWSRSQSLEGRILTTHGP